MISDEEKKRFEKKLMEICYLNNIGVAEVKNAIRKRLQSGYSVIYFMGILWTWKDLKEYYDQIVMTNMINSIIP